MSYTGTLPCTSQMWCQEKKNHQNDEMIYVPLLKSLEAILNDPCVMYEVMLFLHNIKSLTCCNVLTIKQDAAMFIAHIVHSCQSVLIIFQNLLSHI